MRFLLISSLMLIPVHVMAEGLRPWGEWPTFRGDSANQARRGRFVPDTTQKAWSYQASQGVFSTAVVDDQGHIYVGSADTYFYSFDRHGNVNWRYKTGGIVDSAAVLSQSPEGRFITIPSGDGLMHHLRLPESGEAEPQRVWTFDATRHPHPSGKGYDWFEGNIVLGPDGHFYAGNTNWNFYAVDASGQLRWSFPAGNMNWSAAAFDDEGLYVASLDFHFRKLRPRDGKVLWDQKSLGFNAGSLALSGDLVIGTSFDHKVYAFDRRSGQRRWTFAADDHIYSSVAVSGSRIYVTSTDGRLYALTHEGKKIWSYDSRDVIRSSPVVNQSPEGHDVIYFGGGDGRLYAVNADGSFRWAFDTNARSPELKDRNDLNASPALTKTGVVIGGEHGFIWSVPFDYPLLHPDDPRSVTQAVPAESDGVHVFAMTPGSEILTDDEQLSVSPSAVLTFRLQHWKDGQRRAGGMNAWLGRSRVRLQPDVPYEWQVSGDADTLYLKPQGFWNPGQTYELSIDGQWMSDGLQMGGLEIGASKFESFQKSLSFQVAGPRLDELPWQTPQEQVDVIELRRLTVNQPSMMPSLNQIGFDSYHWLISLVEKTPSSRAGEGRLLAWVRGAEAGPTGEVQPGASREFRFPMVGVYKDDAYILSAKNVILDLGGIKVKLKSLEFRGQLNKDQTSGATASFFAEPDSGSDWSYVPAMALTGLINKDLRLPMTGTFLTRDYTGSKGADRPADLQLLSLCTQKPTLWREGNIRAVVHSLQKPNGTFDFLVADAKEAQVLTLTEGPLVKQGGADRWILEQTLPRGTSWPQAPDLFLMAELYPLKQDCRE